MNSGASTPARTSIRPCSARRLDGAIATRYGWRSTGESSAGHAKTSSSTMTRSTERVFRSGLPSRSSTGGASRISSASHRPGFERKSPMHPGSARRSWRAGSRRSMSCDTCCPSPAAPLQPRPCLASRRSLRHLSDRHPDLDASATDWSRTFGQLTLYMQFLSGPAREPAAAECSEP